VLDASAVAADRRFATNPLRVTNRDALTPLVAERLRERSTAEWLELLERAGVPAAPLQDIPAVVADPQTEALGLLQHVASASVPELRLVALPLSFDESRVLHRSAPPDLGEHTQEILEALP
jgi:crotonobetainyl-CoA:carnitine CoA-transferase CaiB-like acyl-CoA transferase